MAGKTMNVAKVEYEQKIKKDIFDIMKSAMLKSMITNTNETNEVANKIAENFALEVANKLSPLLCQTVVDIVSQAQVTGVNIGITTGTSPAGPTTGISTNTFTGTELNLI